MPTSNKFGERTVLLDMDGVIADYEVPNNRIIQTHFPGVRVVLDRAEFYYKDTYSDTPDVVQKIYEENRKPGFFLTFTVVEGAISGIQRIRDAGYSPTICTSPLEEHPTVVEEKIEWMKTHLAPSLGMSIVEEAIFDRDKSGYNAVALIDDRPTIRNSDRAIWQHIMFSRSYNQKIDAPMRLEHWHDETLEQLLQTAYDSYNADKDRPHTS